MKRFLFPLLLLLPTGIFAQDVLILNSGDKRAGKLLGMDEKVYRLQIPIAGPPGGAPGGFVSASIPRSEVMRIEFAADTVREALLAGASPAQLLEIEALWKQNEAWLPLAESPAGKIGLTYGSLLLQSGKAKDAKLALELFKQLESQDWSEANRTKARQGRLQALIATGNAQAAAAEAGELAQATADPAILIQARFILAEAADKELRRLMEENPRWEEDVHVIPQRARLMNAALDDYLYASLFYGSEIEPAARGLWGAAGIYQFTGHTELAIETARDLVALYPTTRSAKLANDYLHSLTDEQKQTDYEKEARDEKP